MNRYMEVRLDGDRAVITLLRDSYMPDEAREFDEALRDLCDRRNGSVLSGVIVDATRVTGYFAIEAARALWGFARFQGGLTMNCSQAHVRAHVAKHFPSIRMLKAA